MCVCLTEPCCFRLQYIMSVKAYERWRMEDIDFHLMKFHSGKRQGHREPGRAMWGAGDKLRQCVRQGQAAWLAWGNASRQSLPILLALPWGSTEQASKKLAVLCSSKPLSCGVGLSNRWARVPSHPCLAMDGWACTHIPLCPTLSCTGRPQH